MRGHLEDGYKANAEGFKPFSFGADKATEPDENLDLDGEMISLNEFVARWMPCHGDFLMDMYPDLAEEVGEAPAEGEEAQGTSAGDDDATMASSPAGGRGRGRGSGGRRNKRPRRMEPAQGSADATAGLRRSKRRKKHGGGGG
ncbi:hypothetical protein EMVG_00099 [Emiliania huxleyi virus PS401]|nr:hypothetical protein EMVG_00099 [Emiliania huxleyi virus PS401]